VRGFNSGLSHDPAGEFDRAARAVAAAERGFAYEGAAMAYALLDLLVPRRRRRLGALLDAGGSDHVYMIHVGAGWALARLRRRPFGRLRLHPLLQWLAVDGFGFHEGFFRPGRFVRGTALHPRIRGYGRHVFDQGLGRSLWFVDAADPERIGATISAFAPERRADLWSGVGLAAAYAGAAGAADLERLRAIASGYTAHLAQGAAFAATARAHAGNVVAETELGVRILCGRSIESAAQVVTQTCPAVRAADEKGRAYKDWRGAIRDSLGAAA
jgi:hypothetical protein